MDLREWLIAMPELLAYLPYRADTMKRVDDIAVLLPYAFANPTRRRRTPVDVDAEVQKWKETILALCTSHSQADVDEADFALDDIFQAILAAPIRQLREFYPRLVEALKDDSRVPFIVWRTFELWAEGVLTTAEDSASLELKDDLASYIAGAVEKEVQPDIMDAMFNALRWRPEAELAAIKRELDEGATPRVTGRSSCLFLVVGKAKVML